MLVDHLHSVSVLLMTGVIWIIQLLVYPGFANIDPAHWARAHSRHTRVMGIIALPLMLTELVTAGFLAYAVKSDLGLMYFGVAALLWFMTMFVFVPMHNRLARRPNRTDLEDLVKRNWVRTGLWSVLAISIIATPMTKSENTWLPKRKPIPVTIDAKPELDALLEER